MPGFGDVSENDFTRLIYNRASIGNLADASGSTVFWLALHTADPTDAGTQGTNEGGYPAYRRMSVARSTAGFAVTGNSASPVSAIAFPENTSTSTGTFTHASLGFTSAASTGGIVIVGALAAPVHFGEAVSIQVSTDSVFTLE